MFNTLGKSYAHQVYFNSGNVEKAVNSKSAEMYVLMLVLSSASKQRKYFIVIQIIKKSRYSMKTYITT